MLPWRRPFRLHHTYERVLGTELEVQVVADTRTQAEAAEAAGLAEITRLTAILNRFDPGSEFRRWLARPSVRTVLSPELLEVLGLADRWRDRSGGAFHPGADAFGALWQEAARHGTPPPAGELADLAGTLRAAPWTLHGDGTATLHATYPLGLNALAKGYVVDAAARAIYGQPGVRSVLVNVGGDLRVLGGDGVSVQVADPFTARDNAAPLATVRVQDGALATSGGAHRGVRVGETWHPHLIDPRTGQPVAKGPGVTVTAPDCATADALATALSVLDVPDGLALADATPGAAALIVTRGSQKHVSSRWAQEFPPAR